MKKYKIINITLIFISLIIIYSIIIYGVGVNSGLTQDYKFQVILKIKKIIENGRKKEIEKKEKILISNDFEIKLKNDNYKYKTNHSAGVVSLNKDTKIYEIDDLKYLWDEYNIGSVINDAIPYMENHGGIKRIFNYNENLIGLVTLINKDQNCVFASLVNFTKRGEIFRANCLDNKENIEFNGIGGGVVRYDNGILFALGVPTYSSKIIDDLAQDKSSPYGKILYFDGNSLNLKGGDKNYYNIYSSGHRNPQGMTIIDGKIYSVEHGPKGGDEINIIIKNANYGWPKVSLGTRYSGEKINTIESNEYKNPIFSFQPSIAPSNIIECPIIIKEKYQGYSCMLISSLRAASIFIVLIDNSKERVISIEKIEIGMRIRDFFIDNGELSITTDGFGAFNVIFSKIPI